MSDPTMRPEASALRARAAEWVRDLNALLAGEWDESYVEDLHEAIDRLAMEADASGYQAIATAALELSTYLCSFIGLGDGPSDTQRRTLVRLAGALAPEAELQPAGAETGEAAVEGVEHPPLPQVWCISDDASVTAALAQALDGRGVEMVIRAPSHSVAWSIPRVGVRAVVVDNRSLDVLPELQREALLRQATDVGRPTYIALLTDGRTSERVRALRAGADHVLGQDADAETMALRLKRVLDLQAHEPLHVLVIDDDRTHTAFCAGILRRVGVDALCCTDSETALAEMRRRLPDVVLVDLHMPGCDGFALTERLLEIPGSEFVSILFLSGDEEPETRFDALTAGGDDFLAKPIQPRHLIRAVAAHGRRAQRRKAAARQR
jgi:DNA-binding response OmpR family regulator